MEPTRSFTGRRRRLQTRPIVKLGDRIARLLITVGGIGTIAAVLLICVFLVIVVLPLFRAPQLEPAETIAVSGAESSVPLLAQLVDDGQLGWLLTRDGEWRAFWTKTGALLASQSPAETGLAKIAAWQILPDGRLLVADSAGKFRFGNVTIRQEYAADLPAGAQFSADDERGIHDGRLWTRTPDGQWRGSKLELALEEVDFGESGSAPRVVAAANNTTGDLILGALWPEGGFGVRRYTRSNGKWIPALEPIAPPKQVVNAAGQPPEFFAISGLGEYLYFAWPDGQLQRYEIRNSAKQTLAEELDLLPEPEAKLTCLEMLVGGTTLLVGDSLGRVQAWFPVNPGPSEERTAPRLTRGHVFPLMSGPIRQLRPTARNRTVLALDEPGNLRLLYITSDRILAEISAADGPILQAALNPQQDTLLTLGTRQWRVWDYRAAHADINLAGIFRPVWYEGMNQPGYDWETSGSETSEPRFSLVPLIFGTLKATFYSMMFGAPLALLAAFFSSEFLHSNVKSRIKPLIELMASLPSVVLGFVAGLIFAPYLEKILPEALAALALVPLGILLAAYLWQLLPQKIALRAGNWRLLAIGLSTIPGLFAAAVFGQPLEELLFGRPLTAWLNEPANQIPARSSAWGGWVLIFLPLAAFLIAWFGGQFGDPWLRALSQGWSRRRAAILNLVRFAAWVCGAILLAAAAAWLLTALGFDPRGAQTVAGYTPRNALIVGVAMGFAIIPLIYTIADDALSTVPNHLRSASLGAGATPWQTAIRIVVPVAMSGLFSAVMIGLGRAVGETMIVLMAAGNTPIMEFNIFNGFQTLSAGIASELAETPPGGTHYRVLFVAALSLFILTFVINTIAEIVRQRFRRRAYDL